MGFTRFSMALKVEKQENKSSIHLKMKRHFEGKIIWVSFFSSTGSQSKLCIKCFHFPLKLTLATVYRKEETPEQSLAASHNVSRKLSK